MTQGFYYGSTLANTERRGLDARKGGETNTPRQRDRGGLLVLAGAGARWGWGLPWLGLAGVGACWGWGWGLLGLMVVDDNKSPAKARQNKYRTVTTIRKRHRKSQNDEKSPAKARQNKYQHVTTFRKRHRKSQGVTTFQPPCQSAPKQISNRNNDQKASQKKPKR